MKKFLMTLTAVVMTLTALFSGISWADTDGQEQKNGKNREKITIVFSHDMHSHLEKFSRIKTVIDEELSSSIYSRFLFEVYMLLLLIFFVYIHLQFPKYIHILYPHYR